jgi:8-oxo-dGTP pyrophosphatase MutT (NUDIX family)
MGSRRKSVETRVQYAALPYRRNGDARTEVMLVTSRETRRWIIPKGWPHKGRTPHRSAAREAYEEAGVAGRVCRDPVGSFSYEKRLPTGGTVVCKVHVFALEVRRQSREWPEKSEREVRWLSPGQAAKAVKEPMLAKIILRLARVTTP